MNAILLNANALHIPLASESVQTVITSPPYYGLRDYGTATWEGGSVECDHSAQRESSPKNPGAGMPLANRSVCSKCGAIRVDHQIGLERTPAEYVDGLVRVFREVWRVLKDDGVLWLNLGDSYHNVRVSTIGQTVHSGEIRDKVNGGNRRPIDGLKGKDLIGIPWMVAFALRADGWYLRSDIIWHKPNPMPESVTDRPTKSHEYIFLLSKSATYYYDAEAIAEPSEELSGWAKQRANGINTWKYNDTDERILQTGQRIDSSTLGKIGTRNKRTVWTVATSPYSEAHFATFPPKLVEPMILAGSRGPGKRCDCSEVIFTPIGSGESEDPTLTTGRAGMNRVRRPDEGTRPITRREQREYAYQMKNSHHRNKMEREAGSAFEHYIRTDSSGARPLPQSLIDKWTNIGWLTTPTPCDCQEYPGDLVLDPFAGTATVGRVAIKHQRRFVGLELNPAYIELAQDRTSNVQVAML